MIGWLLKGILKGSDYEEKARTAQKGEVIPARTVARFTLFGRRWAVDMDFRCTEVLKP